jgi:hypothetical protein
MVRVRLRRGTLPHVADAAEACVAIGHVHMDGFRSKQ